MPYLIIAGIAWFIAQFIKVIIHRVQEGEWDWSLMTSSGNMPSSHSAFVCAIAAQIGLKDHFNTTLFALATAFAIITMFDSMNVRRSVGIQAQELNDLIKKLNDQMESEKEQVKELRGHTPRQVAMGCLLGVGVGILGYLFFLFYMPQYA